MKTDFTNFDQLPIMLTVEQVAQILNLSKTNAYCLFNSTNFPSMKVGKKWLISKNNFMKWIDEVSVINV